MLDRASEPRQTGRRLESGGDPAEIQSLLATLVRADGSERQRARQRLVAIGEAAVKPLTDTLSSPNDVLRWEAAKALSEIRHPAAAEALVGALEDEDFAIRWLAGEGLIGLGRMALPPLLRALALRSDSVWLREGAQHVLHELAKDGRRRLLTPMLRALNGPAPVCEVAITAEMMLDHLTSGRRSAA